MIEGEMWQEAEARAEHFRLLDAGAVHPILSPEETGGLISS